MAVSNWAERQKANGVKLQLTPYPARNCWKKYHKGNVRYIYHPITKDGYESAILEWAQIKAEIDQGRPNAKVYHHHKELFQSVQGWYDSHGAANTQEKRIAKQVDQFLIWIDGELQKPELEESLPSDDFTSESKRKEFYHEFVAILDIEGIFGFDDYELPPVWKDRLNRSSEIKNRKTPQTVGYWIEDFIKLKASKAVAEQLKPKTLMDATEKIAKFRKWIGDDTLIVDITGQTIKDWYQFILSQPFNNKKNYFNYGKSFIRYAWEQEECALENLPRNINSKDFTFKSIRSNKKKAKTRTQQLWSKAEFKKALESDLPERYKCWIMLMLNCGFTQIDLNELEREEVDLKAGRIVRTRSKTEDNENVPVVNYKLWPQTIKLLKKEMARCTDEVYALQASRGARIINERIEEVNGQMITRRSDNISRHWQNIRDDAGLKGKLLKYVRKTGSTKLNSELLYRPYHQMYLGHAFESVSDRNYNAYDGEIYKPLDQAITWLGKQYGF
ncbi:hypothetical protein [Gimesia maris]|uniref:hypothetical protein n=1 Tax=Gimesia maris TaxID=122 RepID=UPI003A8DB142